MTRRLILSRPMTALAAALAVLPPAAFAATALEAALVGTAAPYIVSGIMAVVGIALGWLAATSERFAAPARAKSPEERTLMEKAAIEADRKIDQINVRIIETFAERWVYAHLPRILQTPVFDPMRQAEVLVDDALEAFKRRNPEIAASTGIGRLTLQEIMAAVVGRDQLADALRAAGQPAIDVPAYPPVRK